MLADPRPEGPVLGYFAGQAIPTAVVDLFGHRFTYAGIASRLRSGRYDVDSLRPGEWLVEPGLIYYRDPNAPDGLLKRLRRHSDRPATGSF
jgi:hypothetical protein